MKKYSKPNITVTVFSSESIIAVSAVSVKDSYNVASSDGYTVSQLGFK